MATINRINTMISDRNMAANTVALFVLISFSVLSAAAINHSGNLVKSSFNTLPQSISTPQTPAAEVPTTKAQPFNATSTIEISSLGYPASIQGDTQNLTQMQPAQDLTGSKVAGQTIQSSTNNMQQTAPTPQDAVSIQ